MVGVVWRKGEVVVGVAEFCSRWKYHNGEEV